MKIIVTGHTRAITNESWYARLIIVLKEILSSRQTAETGCASDESQIVGGSTFNRSDLNVGTWCFMDGLCQPGGISVPVRPCFSSTSAMYFFVAAGNSFQIHSAMTPPMMAKGMM